jgi:hypothetical protein
VKLAMGFNEHRSLQATEKSKLKRHPFQVYGRCELNNQRLVCGQATCTQHAIVKS